MKRFDTTSARALLGTVMDSVDGFDHVGEHSASYGLYTYCMHRAVVRRQLAGQLHCAILAQGIRPDKSGSLLAAIHRAYMLLRSLFAGKKRATVREFVRGENFLEKRLETSLATIAMPDDVAEIVRRLHQCVNESQLELAELSASMRKSDGRPASAPSRATSRK